MSAASRQLFVTTALPYANGNFHIGHIMEYIQADIWVRFQRAQGHMVHFVGADDAHGAPIMIAAEKAGILKPGVPAAIAPQADSVREVIERQARRVRAPLVGRCPFTCRAP